MLWQKLTKAALLGTENNQLEEPTLQRLAALGVDTHQESPLLLANGISLLSLMRKAGFQLVDFQGEIPVAAAKALSHTPKALHLLHLMLTGPHGDVLQEYLGLLKKAGMTLPASELPALMGQREITTTWEEVEPLLGEDGHWLLRQHPEWSKLLEDPTQYNWQTGSRQERLKMLTFWRKQSPKFALELIQSSWELDPPSEKAAFLAILQTNLSLADAPFLEACLNEKRKEVRQVAAILLAKIPGSALSVRMEARTAQVLAIRNNCLQVNLPEEPDEAAQRDGIQKLAPDWQGGAKASNLGQLVSRINPTYWETHFKMPPFEVVAMFQKSDWWQTLRQAIVAAIVFHQERKWAELLAEQLLKDGSMTYTSIPQLDAMLELLSSGDAHRLAMLQLHENAELPSHYSIPFYLLLANASDWPNELSLLIINKFRKEIYKDYRQFWQMQHLQEWLKLLGLRCNPSLYDQLQTGWTNTDVQWRYWEKPVEEMLARVLFRWELSMELQA
jgi:hypothetical protein